MLYFPKAMKSCLFCLYFAVFMPRRLSNYFSDRFHIHFEVQSSAAVDEIFLMRP